MSTDWRRDFLVGKLREHKLSINRLPELLFVSRGTAYNRLDDPDNFRIYELVQLAKTLNFTDKEILKFVKGSK